MKITFKKEQIDLSQGWIDLEMWTFVVLFKVFSYAKMQVISDEKPCLRMYFKLNIKSQKMPELQ